MSRVHDTAFVQHTDTQHKLPEVRSYQEIARILAEREGASISSAEVEQMCRTAERKIAHATRTDPVIDHWLASVHHAHGRSSPGVTDAVRHGSSEEYGYHE